MGLTRASTRVAGALLLLPLSACRESVTVARTTGAAATRSAAVPTATRVPLALHRCVVAAQLARCGTLEVYENRATRRGRRIPLVVVVLPARERGGVTRAPDPILLLTGGPGIGAATEASTAELLGAARDGRDVVLVDQRGTGGSAPLDCDLYGGDPRAFLGRRFPPAAVRSCRAVLERRADLTRYSTNDAADDLDDVRAALGYDQVNLFGLSYGSRVALVYMRRHGPRVRSAVLDGVVTTSYPTPLPAAAAAERALERVFADCAADVSCHGAFPDVGADFRAAMARLGREPAAVTLPRFLGATRERASLDRQAFAQGVWRRLYGVGRARSLPLVLHRAAGGDFGAFAREVAADNARAWRRGSAGALLSIVCSEDVPFLPADEVERADATALLGAPLSRQLIAACAEWPRAPVSADYREAVRSEVPTLLISGELDPVSPPEWAERAVGTLPNGRHVVRSLAGHVDDDACTRALVATFYARPDPRALDARCAGVARRPSFRLK